MTDHCCLLTLLFTSKKKSTTNYKHQHFDCFPSIFSPNYICSNSMFPWAFQSFPIWNKFFFSFAFIFIKSEKDFRRINLQTAVEKKYKTFYYCVFNASLEGLINCYDERMLVKRSSALCDILPISWKLMKSALCSTRPLRALRGIEFSLKMNEDIFLTY